MTYSVALVFNNYCKMCGAACISWMYDEYIEGRGVYVWCMFLVVPHAY